MRTCGNDDAQELYRLRRNEDSMALEALGASWVHLGLTDALFRRAHPLRDASPCDRASEVAVKAETAPTGLGHETRLRLRHRALYPTYHLDLAKGRIATSDRDLVGTLACSISRLTEAPGSVVFAPLAIGNHVDHKACPGCRSIVPGRPDGLLQGSILQRLSLFSSSGPG